MMTRPGPDALVISGGGLKGLVALGAVHALRTSGALKDVKTVAGTSSGAIIAAAVALDRKPTKILREIMRGPYVPRISLDNIASGFGLDSGAQLTRWIDLVLEPETETGTRTRPETGGGETNVRGGGVTFAEVRARTGVDLIVCATNLSKREPVYFGPDTTPDMDVATAIKMSCTVPFYFSAMRHEGDVFVDGCLVDNFPLTYVADTLGRQPLGITYADKLEDIRSIEAYTSAIAACIVKTPQAAAHRVLTLDAPISPIARTRPAAMKAFFKSGVEQANCWLKKTL